MPRLPFSLPVLLSWLPLSPPAEQEGAHQRHEEDSAQQPEDHPDPHTTDAIRVERKAHLSRPLRDARIVLWSREAITRWSATLG